MQINGTISRCKSFFPSSPPQCNVQRVNEHHVSLELVSEDLVEPLVPFSFLLPCGKWCVLFSAPDGELMQTTLLRYANKRASLIKIHDKKEVITSKQSERTGCIPSKKFQWGSVVLKLREKKAKCFLVEIMHFSNIILQFYIETINRNVLNKMLFFIIFLQNGNIIPL